MADAIYGVRPGVSIGAGELLRRVNELLERMAAGEPIRPNEERMLRMDVRECLGITGEGKPWIRS